MRPHSLAACAAATAQLQHPICYDWKLWPRVRRKVWKESATSTKTAAPMLAAVVEVATANDQTARPSSEANDSTKHC